MVTYLDLVLLGWDAGRVGVDGVVDSWTACRIDVFTDG